jgi:ligand-binding sensor domain-containing protein/AraC-like DNA-binding protein
MKRPGDFGLTRPFVISTILVQLIWLIWSPLWGLDPDKTVDQYLVNKWQTRDVIPSDTIASISQTPDGYLWLATSIGLVRFDGIKFTIIPFIEKKKIDSPENPIILKLFLDERMTLWIGGFSTGLTSFHSKTGKSQTFTTADGLTENSILCINEDMKGNLWLGFYTSYAGRFSNGEFTSFNESHGLSGKKISTIVEDGQGNLLFGSRENGVFKYKDGKFFKYPIPGLENQQIVTMYEDGKETLWIGTDKGLFRVTDESTSRYTTTEGLSNDYITDIVEDSERNLWLATVKGLNRIKRNPDGTIGFERLLQDLPIICLFEDSEKSLWVGTDGSGLRRLKDIKFMYYAPLEARKETAISVFEDRHGDTWIGTLAGKLLHYRGSNFIESIESSEISGTRITAITEDACGNLWLGTIGRGIFQQEKGTFILFTGSDRLTDKTVTSIYRDRRDHIWFCTLDGINILRHPNGVFESFTSTDGLLGKRINNVYEDKNQNIWIAADKGITVLKDGKISKPDKKYYLKGDSVACIYEDSPNLDRHSSVYWIATYGAGLKRLDLKDGKVISLTAYTRNDGMTTNSIFQFLEDQQGNFWLMSNSGILQVSKTELNRFARGELEQINCISFGISDGLKSLEFNNELSRHSALKTRSYELWFITKKGIAVVDPDKVRKNKVKPNLVIEAAIFDQNSIAFPQGTETYIFRGIKDSTFHFTAPTFLSPEKIKFKYRLEGFDRKWLFLSPGKERTVHYRDLGPGTYTFRVTACNAEGVWNQNGAAVTFTLKPFFYQTLLFKIAAFLLFAGLLAAAVFIYKKRPFDKKKKYKDSTLNPQFAEVCIKRLNYLVENEKIYLDENISLQSLAEKLNIQPYQLSQLLNEKMNQSFSDFINYQRIEEAKKILTSPKGAEKKNTAVAFDVGFNSMTAFYKAFKKFTGMTPNRYKKEIKKK